MIRRIILTIITIQLLCYNVKAQNFHIINKISNEITYFCAEHYNRNSKNKPAFEKLTRVGSITELRYKEFYLPLQILEFSPIVRIGEYFFDSDLVPNGRYVTYDIFEDANGTRWLLAKEYENLFHGDNTLKFTRRADDGKGSYETVIKLDSTQSKDDNEFLVNEDNMVLSGPDQQTYNKTDHHFSDIGHVIDDVVPGFDIICGSDYYDIEQKPGLPNKYDKRLGKGFVKNVTDEHSIEVIGSMDPNDISGTSGYGSKNWIAQNQVLFYKIRFENDPDSATAAAQQVVIKLPFNEHMDIESFQLGSFGFGEFTFSDGMGKNTYNERLLVAESLGVDVEAIFEIDKENNMATWTFTSIDTVTGMPTTDPFAGFLPINDTALHNGEGFVSFTIKPAKDSKTGNEILASADIFFDLNDPIKTNVWHNTIDISSPNSQVVSDIKRLDGYTYSVTWDGDDENGSGIKDYSIYYSDTTGIIKRWLENTSESNAEFTGELGNTYTFYSTSRDNVKNLEAKPENYDAELVVTEFTNTEVPLIQNTIKIYPNPSTCCFTIEKVNGISSGVLNFQVIDGLGRVIHFGVLESDSYLLNLSNQSKGIYILKLSIEESIQYHRLILQ